MSDDDAAAPPPSEVDHGLCGLGLLMQLAGDLGVALFLFLGLQLLVALFGVSHAPGGAWMLFLYVLLGVVRFAAYRSAGSTLLFGGSRSPIYGFLTYGAFSLAQAAVIIELLRGESGAPSSLRLSLIAADLAWPLVLLGVGASLRERGKLRSASRIGDGYGLDGVPVLMLVVGVIGLVLAGLSLALLVPMLADHAELPLICLTLAALAGAARALLHVRAGVVGAFGGDVARFEAAARGYLTVARAGAYVIAAALGVALSDALDGEGGWRLWLLLATAVGAILFVGLSWPGSVRRVLDERHADAWADGRAQVAYVPAADRGLGALGWLHLSVAVASAVSLLGTDARAEMPDLPGPLGLDLGLVAHFPDGKWLLAGATLLQVWAGIELCFATARARAAALVYAAGALAAIGVTIGPNAGALLGAMRSGGFTGFALIGALALALALPLATLALALRSRPQ